MGRFDVREKHVVVAGGSRGLGRELALQLVTSGAHVTILARDQAALKGAHKLLSSSRISQDQRIVAKSLDLLEGKLVEEYISQLHDDDVPDAVFCVAGGTEHELGFFRDIPGHIMRQCMDKNYHSSVYLAQAVWKRWTASSPTAPGPLKDRHLVFTASTAALISIPGYDAYCPTKAAIRSLTDVLRQEALLYSSTVNIRVHCSFPGTIYTDSFYREQEKKPDLCKRLEGSEDNGGGMSAKEIARRILKGLDRGEYFVTTDFQTRLLLDNMRGCSPKDGPLLDWLLGLVMSLAWPVVRMFFDSMVKKEAAKR